MTEEINEEQNYVELSDEDGNITKCEVLDVIEFEDKTYALLLPMENEEYDEEEVIVLEYYEEDGETYFKNIEDEDEFNRVCEYVQSLNEEEDEEE